MSLRLWRAAAILGPALLLAGLAAAGSANAATTSAPTLITTNLSMVSGSLPPGLQIGGQPGACGTLISGTPTQAGTYPFTMKVTSLGKDELGVTEPSSTQQLTITIGTGNSGALYSLSVTKTGQQLVAPESMAGFGGDVALGGRLAYPCPTDAGCSLTVTDSLGSSATVFLGPIKY